MQPKTTVCTVIDECFHDRFCIEHAIKNAGIDFNLILGFKKAEDVNESQIEDFIRRVLNIDKYSSVKNVFLVEISEYKNWLPIEFAKIAQTEFVCWMPQKHTALKNWLFDLQETFEATKHRGVAAISELKTERVQTNVLAVDDSFIAVEKPKNNNSISGAFLFEQVATDYCNANSEYELCNQIEKFGREVYYIKNQIIINTN